ncbi:hypothetical protein [Desulfosporosinus sp. I2]|uniref:polyphosphate kinase 2 family protein n=1 Tax=Desulfosporosinus sp. I2 TaxID=1617025 RepID=UPI00249E23B4|nr:hypothetical protein [Desulfosporosinus sp. I2]
MKNLKKRLEVLQREMVAKGISLIISFAGTDEGLKGKVINELILNLDQRNINVCHLDKKEVLNYKGPVLKKLWEYVPQRGKMTLVDNSYESLLEEQISQELISEDVSEFRNYLTRNNVVSLDFDLNEESIDLNPESDQFEGFVDGLRATIIVQLEAKLRENSNEAEASFSFPSKKNLNLDDLTFSNHLSKAEYSERVKEFEDSLRDIPQRLGEKKKSLMILFEGLDGAGKGTCIKEIARHLDPREYKVYPRVLLKDFAKGYPDLYYYWKAVPKYGKISIMDRTWYNWVLDKRVNNECDEKTSAIMMNEIKAMERQMTHEGVILLKFWVCISYEEQGRRFAKRMLDPAMMEKSLADDLENRKNWSKFKEYAEIMITETSTAHAPWVVIEANSLDYAKEMALKEIIEKIER